MEKNIKRLLSFAVALVMVFGLIPVTQIEAQATTNDKYTKDLEFRESDGLAYCPHCKDWVEWTPIDAAFKGDTSSSARKSGDYHFYIPDAEDGSKQTVTNSKIGHGDFFLYLANATANSKETSRAMVCLHMNGNNLNFGGVIWLGGGDLNIMGTGTLSGGYKGDYVASQPYRGGTINIHSGWSHVNIYSGTITNHSAYAATPSISTTTNYSGTTTLVTMHGGRIEKGVNVGAMTFTMNGGTISGGVQVSPLHTATDTDTSTAVNYVESGNSSANFVMNGGTIEGGNVRVVGGDINDKQTATFTMNDGTIKDGNGQPTLQIIRCTVGTVKTTYSKVTKDTANNGGNVYVASGTKGAATFIMNDGTISGGTVTGGNGGNIYVTDDTTAWAVVNAARNNTVNAVLQLKAGTITDGTAIPTVTYKESDKTTTASGGLGGNIYHYNTHRVETTTSYGQSGSDEKLTITKGTAYAGGNIYHTRRGDKTITVDGTKYSFSAMETMRLYENVEVSWGKAVTASDGQGHSIRTECFGGNIWTNYQTFLRGTVSDGTSDYHGGNIYNLGTLITEGKCLVTRGNAAFSGGNIYGAWRVTLNEGTVVSHGIAGTLGGNIYSGGGAFDQVWTNATVTDGLAEQGGNVYFATKAGYTTTMTGCTIQNGTATGGTETWYGGGNLYCANRTYIFTNCTFSNGTCKTQNGGNFVFTKSSNATFTNCTISDGKTEKSNKVGANLYVTGGHVTLNSCTISGGEMEEGLALIYAGAIIEEEKDTPALVVNGGTIGTAADKDKVMLRMSGAYTKVIVNDGTVYGNGVLEASAKLTVHHGKFTMALPSACLAENSVLAQKTGDFYEVHVKGAAGEAVDKTCTTDGYTPYTCAYSNTDLGLSCTSAFNADVVSASHEPEKQDGKAATHTEDGYAEYWFCDDCDTYFADEACTQVIENVESWKIGAGKIEAEGHDWGEEIAKVDATCSKTGFAAHYRCGVCEAYAVKEGDAFILKTQEELTIAIDENNHSYGEEPVATFAGNCVEKATATYKCSGCGDEKVVPGEVNANVHKSEAVLDTNSVKEATCYADGFTGNKICPDCKVVVTKGTAISKDTVSHTVKYKDITETQHTAYCEVAECEWTETENHTYVDGKCVCGAEEKSVSVVVVPTDSDKVTVGGETVADEQKEVVEEIIGEILNNQATDKVDTGLTTNDAAKEALKELLVGSGVEENEAAEAADKARPVVLVELKDMGLTEENLTKLTFDVQPVLQHEDVTVPVVPTGVVKFHLPVPNNIAAGTMVKVYHKEDLMGQFEVLNGDGDHKYVEVQSESFSPFTVVFTAGQASVGTKDYATLQEALDAAAVSGGTVYLHESVDLGSAMILVMDNVTLDLNGNELTTTGYVMAVFTGSSITDSSEGNTGRLNISTDKLRLLNDNEQLPVQTADDGIMFVDVAIEGKWSETSNCFKFWFDEEVTDAALVEQLKNGSAASKLQIQVELTWNGGQNQLSAVYSDDVLANYLANWDKDGCLLITVTNLGGISDLRYVAKVVFAQDTEAEVVHTGAPVAHMIGQ